MATDRQVQARDIPDAIMCLYDRRPYSMYLNAKLYKTLSDGYKPPAKMPTDLQVHARDNPMTRRVHMTDDGHYLYL